MPPAQSPYRACATATGRLERDDEDESAGDGDGHLYYGHKSYVVQLNLENGVASIIGAAPGRIESIALHPSADFIVNAGPELYRVNRK